MKNVITAGLLTFFAASMGIAAAQDSGHLNVTTIVQMEQVTIDEAGKRSTQLVEVSKVVPGDEVIYTVTFSNIGDEPVENVVITNPLPEQLTYIDGSAFGPGADIVFSADGGKTFGKPGELTVDEEGTQRIADARDFTHIRWVMRSDIAAGSQGVSQFRARLD